MTLYTSARCILGDGKDIHVVIEILRMCKLIIILHLFYLVIDITISSPYEY